MGWFGRSSLVDTTITKKDVDNVAHGNHGSHALFVRYVLARQENELCNLQYVW